MEQSMTMEPLVPGLPAINYQTIQEVAEQYRIDYNALCAAIRALRGTASRDHPDDVAVDRFALAMKAKLAAGRKKGRGGWDDPERCSVEVLARMLVEHTLKGNAGTFEDVANFAMMLHARGADPAVLAAAARRQA